MNVSTAIRRPAILLAFFLFAPFFASGGALAQPASNIPLLRTGLVFPDLFMQERNYSCGAAALSTFLSLWIGDNYNETELLDTLFQLLSPSEHVIVERGGLRSSDISRIVNHLGYEERWEKVSIDQYHRVREPVIIFLNYDGQPHWAIYKGIIDDYVYIGDPAIGNIRLTLKEFEELWAIEDENTTGIMVSIQRPDTRNLGEKSPFRLNLIGNSHRSLQEYRSALSLGSLQAGQVRVDLTYSNSRVSQRFEWEGEIARLTTETHSITPNVEFFWSDSWSISASSSLVRTDDRIDYGDSSASSASQNWEDLYVSLNRIFLKSSLSHRLTATLQSKTEVGAPGFGLSAFTSRSFENHTLTVGIDYLHQWISDSSDIDQLLRPTKTYSASMHYQYSFDYATTISASITRQEASDTMYEQNESKAAILGSVSFVKLIMNSVIVQPTLDFVLVDGTWQHSIAVSFSKVF